MVLNGHVVLIIVVHLVVVRGLNKMTDNKTIGVEKDIKYTEHTIDIKDYIELYISTHHYIRNFIDIYDFLFFAIVHIICYLW